MWNMLFTRKLQLSVPRVDALRLTWGMEYPVRNYSKFYEYVTEYRAFNVLFDNEWQIGF